jgi:LysR family glycine cleavage system transcriptional activator
MRAASPSVLRQLRVFCVSARSLSFKSAAAILYLSPSAVSHQVRELEDHLGLRLFERKTRALELTIEGHRLLREVEPLLNAIDEAIARVTRVGRPRSLRVALPPFFASELFIPRLSGFYTAQPDIDLHVTTENPRPSEHAAGADISVLLLDERPQGLVAHQLFSLRLLAACAPSILARASELGRNVFSESPLIVHRTRADAWERWAHDAGLTPPARRKVIELDSMYSVVRAADQGLGIALVPEVAASEWFDRGSLVRFAARELETGDRYYLVHRPEDSGRPEIGAFIDWAIREFSAPVSGTEA